MEYVLGTVIIIQTAYIIYSALLHKQERNDLYNRIMARDYTEYKAQERNVLPKNKNFVEEGIRHGVRSQFGPE